MRRGWRVPDLRFTGPASWGERRDHWICSGCDTEFVGFQFCPNCGSEDTFPKNDNGWACLRCGQFEANHDSVCLRCVYRLHPEPQHGL